MHLLKRKFVQNTVSDMTQDTMGVRVQIIISRNLENPKFRNENGNQGTNTRHPIIGKAENNIDGLAEWWPQNSRCQTAIQDRLILTVRQSGIAHVTSAKTSVEGMTGLGYMERGSSCSFSYIEFLRQVTIIGNEGKALGRAISVSPSMGKAGSRSIGCPIQVFSRALQKWKRSKTG